MVVIPFSFGFYLNDADASNSLWHIKNDCRHFQQFDYAGGSSCFRYALAGLPANPLGIVVPPCSFVGNACYVSFG